MNTGSKFCSAPFIVGTLLVHGNGVVFGCFQIWPLHPGREAFLKQEAQVTKKSDIMILGEEK